MCPGREGTNGRRQRSGREDEPTGILLYMYVYIEDIQRVQTD